MRRLTEAAQDERDDFDIHYKNQGCQCCIRPPCNFCTHPGNPMNQDDDSCWEDDVAECNCESLLFGHMPNCPYVNRTAVVVPKFVCDQKVMIRSTDELPTRHNGTVGYIVSQRKSHPEFWHLITFNGFDAIFHESQLSETE